MGLFRRPKQSREPASPQEAAAEATELGHDGVLRPNVYSVTPVVKADPEESDLENEELLSSADPEDDTTRELLIERERQQEDPDY
jgi:hypothetical protein